MLSQQQRTTILELDSKGVSKRAIARLLGVSRGAVERVLDCGSAQVPRLERAEKAEPYRDEILVLYATCRGNLVRVHEELSAQGASLSYPALTAFCRRHGIGHEPKTPVGSYHFAPGQELQHDTSPHWVELSGSRCRVQTASAVLCYSRMLYFQCYPRFRRFECKVFLTDALVYFGGSPRRVEIDNTHVVVLSGTGAQMVPTPEMAAFGERYGFAFQAHERGDVNRSARVERPFHYIENNFLAGRSFADYSDLNQQARDWCERVNRRPKRHLKASPLELFAREKIRLLPLPLWVPEPYRLHHRIVDTRGYVTVDTHRYSVPADWIGRQVEARESKDRIDISCGHQSPVSHPRFQDDGAHHATLPEHRRQPRRLLTGPSPEEKTLSKIAPQLGDYIQTLKKKGKKQTTLVLRQLVRMVRDYPPEPLHKALSEAHHYGLVDLDRVERMVLRHVAKDYFRLQALEQEKGADDER